MGKQNKKIKEIKKIVEMTCGKGRKWWEVFPLGHLVDKGEKEEKSNKKGKEEKKMEEKKKTEQREREKRKKKKRGFPLLSKIYKNWAVDFHRRRGKVGPHNEGYAWVPKFGSFVKPQVVGNFPTRIISILKAILWHGAFFEAVCGHDVQSQNFGTKCRNF